MTRVVHVLHTWGSPSETFVRSLVDGVPGVASVVVAHQVVGERPDAPTIRCLGPVRRALPGAAGAKAAIAVGAVVGARHRAALVHAHFAHELLLADRMARVLRRPLVVSLHGRDLLVELDAQPQALEVVRRAAAVVVPSTFLARAASARGVATNRLAVIPSGVDLAELPFRERHRPAEGADPMVLFVGRFVEKKGVLDAARAVVAVASTHRLRARFVGTGELEGELAALLAPLGERAEIVDGTDRRTVLRALAEADLLVSPSRTGRDGDAETLLLVNVEAQAAGIPVLTTDHGGIPAGLGPGAAVVVPEGDGPRLQQALAALLDDPDRWAAMGRAGRAHVEAHLTREHTGAAVAALYAATLARPSGRGAPAGEEHRRG